MKHEVPKIKIAIIVGARPQFIKASAICRAISDNYEDKVKQVLIHSGQHYDENMSSVFIDQLDLAFIKYYCNVGQGEPARQTPRMMEKIASVLKKEKPHYVMVFGDTNTTLAGALAGSRMGIRIIHVEAGLRSFNKDMPEEINRILTDHVSTWLFTPTSKGIENLQHEGFIIPSKPPYNENNPAVIHCGDIMYDNMLYFSKIAENNSNILSDLELENNNYILATIHRNINTDHPSRLRSIFSALDKISSEFNIPIVIPLHPRTQKKWDELNEAPLKKKIKNNKLIRMVPAVSYLDFICLESHSKLIITDSGGVQKEAYFCKKKCLILREETEWTELVDNGMAELCGTDEERIFSVFVRLLHKKNLSYPSIYGDGTAAHFIIKALIENSKA